MGRILCLLLLLFSAACSTRSEAPACRGDLFPLNTPVQPS